MATHPKRNRAASKLAAAVDTAHDHDHDYSALLVSVRASFDSGATSADRLFQTDANGLNEIYLDALPGERQVHNCHACRLFLSRYGGLVSVGDTGDTASAMWTPEGVPDFYRPAFAALQDRVQKAKITSVFLTKERVWGIPLTGEWSHMAVVPPASLVYRERALTAGQAMAAAKENFRTVATALAEFKPEMLDEALRILNADALARSEKFIGPVKWLRALHDRPKGRRGDNLLWRAIAGAPEGYCHPKASVIAPLLADIVTGLPFDEIKVKFAAMLHPLRYQRPQAAPAVGNIKAAEALVAKLGIAPSLERRFARVAEVKAIWTPRPIAEREPSSDGVFGHLRAKNTSVVEPVALPASTMTWEKFSRAVMPGAERIEIRVPAHGSFIALTTAVNPEAPPILKWDREDERNPVAWYVYPGGSSAAQWGLPASAWANVGAISLLPTMWGSQPSPFLGEGAVLLIDGALDSHVGSNALFPECLKDELHGARATIEAYSRSATLGGREPGAACGYDLRKSQRIHDCVIRVFSAGAWIPYRIDRWD